MSDYPSHSAGTVAQLIAEERWLIETLQKIREQRNTLEIERMQLESMRAAELSKILPSRSNQNKEHPASNSVTPTAVLPCAEPDPELTCNQTQLDLQISNELDSILSGTFCDGSAEEETESEDEEILGNNEPFMLPRSSLP